MIGTLYPTKKSLVVVGGGRPNLVLSPGPGLWSLVLSPWTLDLLDLTWDLDLSLTIPIELKENDRTFINAL